MILSSAVLFNNMPIMNNHIQLKITDVVYPGKGLARHNGCVVFVRDVLPGEIVTARIIKKRKNYAEADIVSIDQPSPFRIIPICPLAGNCPGCSYQHILYQEELRIKNRQFINLLRQIGRIDSPSCLPPTSSPASLGYRNRITLHTSGSEENRSKKSLGYFAFDNQTIIDIPACFLAVDDINNQLRQLRDNHRFIFELGNNINLTFRNTKIDGTIFWEKGTVPDKAQLTEKTILGPIKISYNTFFQVNIPIADALIKRVTEIITDEPPSSLIDLYCGVGIFAMAAGKAGIPKVLGIDNNKTAIKYARENAKCLDMTGLHFEAMNASVGLEYGLSSFKPKRTTLLVDPPRAGIEKEIISLIAIHKPGMIIYISCAPDTLARDASRLSAAGYNIKKTQIFDMFPRTPYFESVTIFSHQ